jgi:4-aminobutyrate aminotransferase-like enzyme
MSCTDSQQYTTESCLKELETMLEIETLPEEVAVIIVEPVSIPASREFIKGLRKICNTHGIVFIVDEVNAGFGRTVRQAVCIQLSC